MSFFRFQLSAFILALLLSVGTYAHCESDLLEQLVLDSGDTPQESTPRYQRPPSRIAENVSVITSEQIARLNAHTLVDILNTVSGIQFSSIRTPGDAPLAFTLNAMDIQHILVLVDGVPQNDPTTNRADIGLIPAGFIERIEIIKGAASATWGPALGGIINVITKSPYPERSAGGSVASSYGERGTADLNAEASGTSGRFGYYLFGGNLHSKGLLPGNGSNINNLFSKFSYELPSKGVISLSGNISEAFRGLEESASLDYRDTIRDRKYSLNLNLLQPLNTDLNLLINSHFNKSDSTLVLGQITYTPPYFDYLQQLHENGTKVQVNWNKGNDSLTAGADYLHYDVSENSMYFAVPEPERKRRLDRYGVYLNGTAAAGPLTFLPGIRFDHTGIGQDNVSYTLGATYKLSDKSIFRVYGADGFGLPSLDNTGKLQKIWTLQTGLESGDIPYLWIKGTLFYNRASNVEIYDSTRSEFMQATQIRQGFEVELKTVPLFGVSAGAGYTYTDTYDHNNPDRHINYSPTNSLKLALEYDNARAGSKASLLGNYVWWNQSADSFLAGPAYYKPIIWDLHLNQKLFPQKELSPELFFSGHNLFNGSQYSDGLYKNARRWLEGGVRFRF